MRSAGLRYTCWAVQQWLRESWRGWKAPELDASALPDPSAGLEEP